jgi:NAD(P)-dependent dehydrogenase (short-subunit alcohol dehydrogenase family)
MEPRDFEKVIAVNLLGAIRMTKAVLPKLLQSQHAFIVNVASMAGLKGAPGMCAYAASKFGIVGFSEALAAELEGRAGICTVCPTFIKTNIARNALFAPEIAGSERAEKVGAMNTILSMVGSNPRKVSQIIIRSIKERKRLVLVNPDAYFLYYLNRFFPALSDTLVSMAYRRMLQAGVIDL